jgi:tripartite-type tricarboxylate transporter receptor subunit TctC
MSRLMLLALLLAPIVPGLAAQAAEAYPSRPVRFLVAQPPGGPVDIMARVVGQKLGELVGQTVVIDNRPGAGGSIGTVLAARTTPDGYTILVNSSAFAVNPSVYSKAGYDPERDFAPVINAGVSPNLISVHPSVAATTLQELIALAKTKKLSYGSAGTGTTPHLTGERLLKTMAGLDITHVPYAGAGPAVNAVVAGQVPVGSTALPPAMVMVKAGKLRAIALTSLKRVAAAPEVATVAESGFPGYEDYTWIGFWAPAGTPRAIVDKLHADINRALHAPDTKERLDVLGFDPVANTPDQFAAYVREEVAKWAVVVKAAGAKAD